MEKGAVRKRATAVLLSALVWPGAGQVYAGRRVKGAVLMALSGGAVAAVLFQAGAAALRALPASGVLDPAEAHAIAEAIVAREGRSIGVFSLVAVGAWIYSIADALLSRQRGEGGGVA